MSYVYETNGQYLATYLHTQHLGRDDVAWAELGDVLMPSNRADSWIEGFQQMVVLQLLRRLVAGGEYLTDRLSTDTAETEIKQMIVDTMIVHWSAAGDVYERLTPAIRSARRSVAYSDKREVEAFTRRERPYCYLCGVDLLFGGIDEHAAFTIDHVWPRAYGGNPDFENLLGACRSCNEAKGDTPSWAMYPVQSLVAGYGPREMAELPKIMRFSVQTRAAHALAVEESISLREAFLSLGRPSLPLVVSAGTAVDVFNLEHQIV